MLGQRESYSVTQQPASEHLGRFSFPNCRLVEQRYDVLFEMMRQEAFMNRQNLLIDGIPEPASASYNNTGQQVVNFCANILGLTGVRLDAAYRLGYRNPNDPKAAPRVVMARFSSLRDREEIWGKRRNLPKSKYRLREVIPPQLREDQTVLLRVLHAAKKLPDKYPWASVWNYELFLGGNSYRAYQLYQLPEELRPSTISTPCNERVIVFFTKFSLLSNHFPCFFVVNGNPFNTIEQFLAHEKATFAGKHELASDTFTMTAARCKGVLNSLRNIPNEAEWRKRLPRVLYRGLLAKFSQNAELKNYLIATGTRKIGEACTDRLYATGLSLFDENRLDDSKWTGQNLVGKAMMEVRTALLPKVPSNGKKQ